MGKGIVKLGEGQWATKDGKLLAAKETNGRFKNAEFTVTRGSDATYTDKDGLIKRVSAPRNRNTTSSNTLDLFVLAGQSNAMGWLGNASSYPPQEPNLLDSSIKLNYEQIGTTSKSDGWQTLGPQQRQNYGEIFGPEVTFSRLLKRGGYNPAIFKYTEGSTSLADDWKAPGQSGHYDTMVTKFNAAVLDLQNQGYTVNIAGFIWIQGEQDATDATDAGNYQSNLNAIISDFRTNVASNSTLEFVLGVDEGNPASNISTIVTAQTNIANGDANIVRSSMVGLEKADSTHLTPAGIIDHGKRIYDSMFDLASAEPRIDFTDNTDGHLLLEPQSTNLYLNSEPTANEGIEANITYEPFAWDNGFTNCVKFADNSSTTYRYGGTALANTTYTLSCYVIMDDFSKPVVSYGSLFGDNTNNSNFDFSLIIGGIINPVLEEDIKYEDCGNNIWKVSRKGLVGASSLSNNGIIKYTGQSSKGFRVVGWQLEPLSYATSYIPTNGSTVTRDAETCTGAGEAIDFNSEEGVLYAEIAALANDGTSRTIALNKDTNDRIQIYFNTSTNGLSIFYKAQSGATAFIMNETLTDATSFNKIAFKWKANDFALWVNGVNTDIVSSGVTSTANSLNALEFEMFNDSGSFYGKCKAIKVYKDASIDLATLTS